MRTLPAFVAVLGLPLVAQAQPVAGSKSTEVSELIVQARKATAVSDLTVTGHCAVPPETRWPNKMFDPPPNPKKEARTEESPGTRAFVLRDIAALRNNTRDYEHLTSEMGSIARGQTSFTKRQVVCRGAFKDIKFLHVTETGDDDFEVDFSNGPLEWEVRPPNAKQAIGQFAIRFFYPQPVTDQFMDWLNFVQSGQPDYAHLTPDLVTTTQAQWPALQRALKAWGPLRSFYFLRQADDGAYLYAASFQHREVTWEVAPLDGAGKLTSLQYAEAPEEPTGR